MKSGNDYSERECRDNEAVFLFDGRSVGKIIGGAHGSNENELSDRWRERAWNAVNVVS